MATAKKVARRVVKAPAKKIVVKKQAKPATPPPLTKDQMRAAKEAQHSLESPRAKPKVKAVVAPPMVPPSRREVPPPVPGITIHDLEAKPLSPKAAKVAGYTHRTLVRERPLRGGKEVEFTLDTKREYSPLEIKGSRSEGYEIVGFKQAKL